MAQGQEHYVTFLTIPPGAVISLQGQDLGKSGTPLAVPLTGDDHALLNFVIKLQGYETREFSVTEAGLKLAKKLPNNQNGPIVLRPASLAAYLTVFRIPLLGVALLAALGMAVAAHMLRSQKRAHKLEALLARADAGGLEGSVLGGYKLVSLLGAGGMGRVFLGEPQSRGLEPAAVKVLESQDEEMRRRFLREVKLCKGMDHPHIVRIYGWGEEEGATFMAMELVEGGTLRERLRGAGLPPEEVRAVLLPLFQALAHAHERGVVHRDLKPENVMFTRRGTLKVMDFGLSRGDNSTNLTQVGTVVGTPAYMAPEQVQGVSYGPAIDQYALGVLAYELLTGRQPFTAPEPVQVLFMHVGENAAPLTRFRPDLPAEVNQIVLKMLAKAPAARFASVEEAGAHLVDALTRWPR